MSKQAILDQASCPYSGEEIRAFRHPEPYRAKEREGL
jgi:hypothetical protein